MIMLPICHVDIIRISKQVIQVFKFEIICTVSTWQMENRVLQCYIRLRSYRIFFRGWVGGIGVSISVSLPPIRSGTDTLGRKT
jgi:hypothetical protein